MMLTVIVPDSRQGMQRMLARELEDIDSEIIYEDWRSGLEKARGDFILLLEHNSAISRGAVFNQLRQFLDNPHYRKLAMVSPKVDFEDADAMAFSYDSMSHEGKKHCHLAQIGSIAGSLIRRSCLKKHMSDSPKSMVDASYALSIAFWEHGLRIMHDPSSIYYSPDNVATTFIEVPEVSKNLLQMWKQEVII